MTPKEASIEIELIRQQLQRLVRIVGITPADYSTIQDACVSINESLCSISSFIAPLRTKSKPRHPPKVPTVPERIELVDPRKYGLEPNDFVGRKTHEPAHEYLYSIYSGARPLGRLE